MKTNKELIKLFSKKSNDAVRSFKSEINGIAETITVAISREFNIPQREIAETMGTSMGTVSSYLNSHNNIMESASKTANEYRNILNSINLLSDE
jgi:hypothetical protein